MVVGESRKMMAQAGGEFKLLSPLFNWFNYLRPMFERVLALDYGEKRVGVALSDALGLTTTKPFLKNNDDLIKNITLMVNDNQATTIIVGLPLDTSGSHSRKSLEVIACRKAFRAVNL